MPHKRETPSAHRILCPICSNLASEICAVAQILQELVILTLMAGCCQIALKLRTQAVSPVIEINEATDDRLKVFASLRGSQRLHETECFVVEGRWCVRRLIESDQTILSVVAERGKEREWAGLLAADIPLYSLPPDQIRRLVGFDFHRGVLACGRRPVFKQVTELRFRSGAPPVALAALGVSEYENLGSMIRTATALGVEHVMVDSQTVDPWYRRSIRVSMATIFQQHLYRLDQPLQQISALADSQNLRTVVTTLAGDATPLHELRTDERGIILIVGNEATGVDYRIQNVATDRVTIPMWGTDSLNVSVAAAICMYQLVDRHRASGPRDRYENGNPGRSEDFRSRHPHVDP